MNYVNFNLCKLYDLCNRKKYVDFTGYFLKKIDRAQICGCMLTKKHFHFELNFLGERFLRGKIQVESFLKKNNNPDTPT